MSPVTCRNEHALPGYHSALELSLVADICTERAGIRQQTVLLVLF
jgi:hypothetical protein